MKSSSSEGLKSVAGTGWVYNPGKTADYDAVTLDSKLFPDQRTWREWGLEDLRDVPDELRLPASEMLPGMDTREEAHAQIARAFQVSPEKPWATIDTPIEPVHINYHKLLHSVEKKDAKRERYANLAVKALEDPLEIWLTSFEDERTGKREYRKQYITVFQMSQSRSALVSVVEGKDGGIFYNFIASKGKGLNFARKGDAILYRKKIKTPE